MTNLIATFQDRFSDWLTALSQHLQLSLLTLLLAILLAIPLAVFLRYQAIQSGDIQITDAYSTDAELERYDLQVLEDDKQLFPPYQGAPLMKEALLKKHPELERVLNTLAGKITESQMSQLNYQVGVEGKSAKQVAKEFLQEQGLLKK